MLTCCPRGQPLPKFVTVRLGFLGGLKLAPNWANLFIVHLIGLTLDISNRMQVIVVPASSHAPHFYFWFALMWVDLLCMHHILNSFAQCTR